MDSLSLSLTHTHTHTCIQKAMQDNKTAREKQVLQERRLQEREELFKKKRVPPPAVSQDPQTDLKKELEAKSLTKSSSAISTFERKMKSKPKTPEQKDFRHLLRQRQQPDHSSHHSTHGASTHHGHRRERRTSGNRDAYTRHGSRTQPEYDSETLF